MISFSWGQDSNVGKVRQVNQDRALATSGLAVVADGMGGHLGGEVAAEIAVRSLETHQAAFTLSGLVEGVQHANVEIHERSNQDENLRGMGTTLCAIAPLSDGDEPLVGLVNVGDSRVYRLAGGVLEQLTDDHSLVAEMVREGRIAVEDAVEHPQRNILTRALGTENAVEVDSWAHPVAVGERYLLCSDGLFNEVSEGSIAETLIDVTEPAEAARTLVRMANAAGGRDNVTCVVVDIEEGEAVPAAVEAASAARTVHDTGDHGPPSPDEEIEPLRRVDDGPMLAEPPTTSRRFTWRVALFGLAILTVFGVAVVAINAFGNAGYFVGSDAAGDEVVIYQGRRDGFLWFDPSVVERTDVHMDELTDAARDSIESSGELASLAEAQELVAQVSRQAEATLRTNEPRSRPDESTTTTTTTTATTTTTSPSG